MKKLRLDVEELAVEQFSTEAVQEQGPGTVRGRDDESSKPWTGCNIHTCYC